MRVKWSKELIIKRIKELDNQGVRMSQTDIRKLDSSLFYSARNYFGGWRNAVISSGIDYDKILKISSGNRTEILKKARKCKRKTQINEIIIKGTHKEIVIKRRSGEVLHVLVDLDYEHDKRVIINGGGRPYFTDGEYLYRHIMNAQKGDVIDHINRDTLDNRRCNLRTTDAKGNVWNRMPIKGGVSYNNTKRKINKRWRVHIKQEGKKIADRHFLTEEEGREFYRKTILELRGEFAPKEYKSN